MQSSAAGGFVFGGIFLQKRDGKRSPENGGGDNGFKTAAVLQGDCGLLRSICYHKACGLRVGCAAYGASLRISFTDEGDEINAGTKAAGKGSAAVYLLLVRGSGRLPPFKSTRTPCGAFLRQPKEKTAPERRRAAGPGSRRGISPERRRAAGPGSRRGISPERRRAAGRRRRKAASPKKR